MAVRKSALSIEAPAKQDNNAGDPAAKPQTANAGLSVIEGHANRMDPTALAMDQALGLEATHPFSTMSRWNSHAVEFAWSLAPVVCDLFSLAVKACVEVQLSWLSWIPGWQLGAGSRPDCGADGSRAAECMDVAIGAQPAELGSALVPYAAAAKPARAAATTEPGANDEAEPSEKALPFASGM